jgi:hypothetical protein
MTEPRRTYRSGIGRRGALQFELTRMTSTFQNGRERPTACISDSLLRLQCMKSLHSGRERSQRLLFDFCTVILAQRGAHGAGLAVSSIQLLIPVSLC